MAVAERTGAEVLIRVVKYRAGLHELRPDPGLGSFFGYVPAAASRTFASIDRILERGGEALLACEGGTVVGYVTLAHPESDQPWGSPDLPVREVSIEVARGSRGRGLAHRLLSALPAEPGTEDLILVATGYRWCWDPRPTPSEPKEGADHSRWLRRLFASAGFVPKATNEPNVAMDPINFLVVRVGARVAPEAAARFERTLMLPLAA